MKANRVTTGETLGDIIAKLALFLIMIGLPIYMDKNFYTALIGAKAHCYSMIAVVLLLALLGYLLYGIFSKEIFSLKDSPVLKKPVLLDLAIVVFAASILISFVESSDKTACFWGTNGFRCGTFMAGTLFLFYFVFSFTMRANRKTWDMIFVVADIICVWILLNSVSVDILNMHAQIVDYQYFEYFASLGQMDSVTAYLCLMIPVGIVFFLHAKKREDYLFYGIFVALGLGSMFAIQTDGIYFGVAFCGVFLLPYIFETYERVRNTLFLGVIAGADLTVLSFLHLLVPDRMKQGDGVSLFLIRHWLGAVLLVLCLAFLFLFQKKGKTVSQKVFRVLGRIGSALMILLLLGFAVFSAMNFDERWGNGRGAIWSASVTMFSDMSAFRKLFGYGLEMIRDQLTPIVNWGLGVSNSHNNVLEVLLCLGIFGLIAYFFVWAAIVIPFLRRKKQPLSVEAVAYFMALVAYFGQSIVGNPYSLTIPMVGMMVILYRSEMCHVVRKSYAEQSRSRKKKRR